MADPIKKGDMVAVISNKSGEPEFDICIGVISTVSCNPMPLDTMHSGIVIGVTLEKYGDNIVFTTDELKKIDGLVPGELLEEDLELMI